MGLQITGNSIPKKITALGKRSAKKFIKPAIRNLTLVLPEPVKKRITEGNLYQKLFKPTRTQRVYIQAGIEIHEFLKILNERKVRYVILRTWEELPHFPEEEDLNLLVEDEDRDKLLDLVNVYETGGRKCDIYTVTGANNGARINVPVFSQNLTRDLLTTRLFYNGGFVPAPLPYFASIAYHALFHKGYNSGIPGFHKKPTKYRFDYVECLKQQALHLGIAVNISVKDLYTWLKEKDYAPADDTLGKLVKHLPELSILEPRLYSDLRGGELMVFVIREQLFHDGLLGDFETFLKEEYQFDILDVHILNEEEKIKCTSQIRGGKWDKGPWKRTGGSPAAIVVAYDYHPRPLTTEDQNDQNRTTNKNTIQAKYAYRKRLRALRKTKEEYNGVHSGDNEFDAKFYLSLIGEAYLENILNRVEEVREQYHTKYNVKEILSTNCYSKVELIQYNGILAVKKTFRPGKEKYFERELFALKELAKVLKFIPPLLKEGEMFVITEFLDNRFKTLTLKEKRKIISSRLNEVVTFNEELLKIGYFNFSLTPGNLLITQDGKFYCTGYSLLEEFTEPEGEVLNVNWTIFFRQFKNENLPYCKTLIQDFTNEWRPYLGLWKKINLYFLTL